MSQSGLDESLAGPRHFAGVEGTGLYHPFGPPVRQSQGATPETAREGNG